MFFIFFPPSSFTFHFQNMPGMSGASEYCWHLSTCATVDLQHWSKDSVAKDESTGRVGLDMSSQHEQIARPFCPGRLHDIFTYGTKSTPALLASKHGCNTLLVAHSFRTRSTQINASRELFIGHKGQKNGLSHTDRHRDREQIMAQDPSRLPSRHHSSCPPFAFLITLRQGTPFKYIKVAFSSRKTQRSRYR